MARPRRAGEWLWIFDLDNTLHDASPHIFPHIDQAMTAYVQEHLAVDAAEANRLRLHYWQRYGATLLGLMRHHGIAPRHFLEQTHRFADLAALLVWDRRLGHLLRRLPGRKVVFSNGPQHYAEAVLAGIRLRRCFAAVYGIEHTGFRPKPSPASFLQILRRERTPPSRAVMVEDSLVNLRTAKALGMRTVWVSDSARKPPCVDLQVRHVGELTQHATRL